MSANPLPPEVNGNPFPDHGPAPTVRADTAFEKTSLNFVPVIQQKQSWLIIFTDLVSLILAFFVLLFSMSTLPLEKWKVYSSAISKSEKPPEENIEEEDKAELAIGGEKFRESLKLDYLAALLKNQLATTDEAKKAIVHRFENRLTISLPSDLLFKTGRAVLSEKGQTALTDISSILRNIDNQVEVFGHTDPTPVTGRSYTSNWELSLVRALAVAAALRQSGYLKDISAFGAADSHYPFISPQFSQSERWELSRRVDIIISPQSGL